MRTLLLLLPLLPLTACTEPSVKIGDDTAGLPDDSGGDTGPDDTGDTGGTDSGDTDTGGTDSGDTGETDSGDTDSGDTDSGDTDSGDTDSGDTGGLDYDGGTGPWGVNTLEDEVDGSGVVYYVPDGGGPWPVVIWSHGFARSPANHASAASRAASWGFLVATPSLPSFTDHEANGEAIATVFLPAARSTFGAQVSGQAAFVGHSAGGLASLVAASITPVDVLVTLDGTDVSDIGIDAASSVSSPYLALYGESSYCNSDGNGVAWPGATRGDTFAVKVNDACHCDFESDTDWLCTVACGTNDASRQDLIFAYAIAGLVHHTVGGADEWMGGSRAEADRSSGRISW